MRTPLVAGNWKMHGSAQLARELLAPILAAAPRYTRSAIAVCPPATLLQTASEVLAGTTVSLGAQNVAEFEPGAYTGEIAAPMLTEWGCAMALCGHSERRQLLGEDNETVARKAYRALASDLTPLVCVGETLEQRQDGTTEAVVGAQLAPVLEQLGAGAANAIIAYEPVWAIGTGETASPEQAQAVHAFIRATLVAALGAAGDDVQLLYGGSVKPGNAAGLFAQEDIDGGLIGGASLVAADFLAICDAAEASAVKES